MFYLTKTDAYSLETLQRKVIQSFQIGGMSSVHDTIEKILNKVHTYNILDDADLIQLENKLMPAVFQIPDHNHTESQDELVQSLESWFLQFDEDNMDIFQELWKSGIEFLYDDAEYKDLIFAPKKNIDLNNVIHVENVYYGDDLERFIIAGIIAFIIYSFNDKHDVNIDYILSNRRRNFVNISLNIDIKNGIILKNMNQHSITSILHSIQKVLDVQPLLDLSNARLEPYKHQLSKVLDLISQTNYVDIFSKKFNEIEIFHFADPVRFESSITPAHSQKATKAMNDVMELIETPEYKIIAVWVELIYRLKDSYYFSELIYDCNIFSIFENHISHERLHLTSSILYDMIFSSIYKFCFENCCVNHIRFLHESVKLMRILGSKYEINQMTTKIREIIHLIMINFPEQMEIYYNTFIPAYFAYITIMNIDNADIYKTIDIIESRSVKFIDIECSAYKMFDSKSIGMLFSKNDTETVVNSPRTYRIAVDFGDVEVEFNHKKYILPCMTVRIMEFIQNGTTDIQKLQNLAIEEFRAPPEVTMKSIILLHKHGIVKLIDNTVKFVDAMLPTPATTDDENDRENLFVVLDLRREYYTYNHYDYIAVDPVRTRNNVDLFTREEKIKAATSAFMKHRVGHIANRNIVKMAIHNKFIDQYYPYDDANRMNKSNELYEIINDQIDKLINSEILESYIEPGTTSEMLKWI